MGRGVWSGVVPGGPGAQVASRASGPTVASGVDDVLRVAPLGVAVSLLWRSGRWNAQDMCCTEWELLRDGLSMPPAGIP